MDCDIKRIKRTKRMFPITLIEIMVVILLIGLIGGVLAYNLSGSLEEGKAFKSREAARQVTNILTLEIAKGRSPESVVGDWENVIKNSPLAGRPKELIRDGWGGLFKVSYQNNCIVISSERYQKYRESHPSPNAIEPGDEWY